MLSAWFYGIAIGKAYRRGTIDSDIYLYLFVMAGLIRHPVFLDSGFRRNDGVRNYL
jgi:hypothetical protein